MIFTTSKTIKNNGIIIGSPFKPNTMTQGSELSNALALRSYSANSGGVNEVFNNKKSWGHGSEEYTFYKKIQAFGGRGRGVAMSYKSVDATSRNSALIRCRSGGCVAPKKKGAVHV